MSSLLPVLQQHNPAMFLCAVCPKPGACCSNFVLNEVRDGGNEWSFWASQAESDVRKKLSERGYPFEVADVHTNYVTRRGWQYVVFKFNCPKLDLGTGRCTIYEDRPNVCRKFVPGSDSLCVFSQNARVSPK